MALLIHVANSHFRRAADEVRHVLEDPEASTSGDSQDRFWTMAAALNGFIQNEGHGNLPLEAGSSGWHLSSKKQASAGLLSQ